MSTILVMEALGSAMRHGVEPEDMQHAVAMAEEAERGYDVEELLQRRRSRPAMG